MQPFFPLPFPPLFFFPSLYFPPFLFRPSKIAIQSPPLPFPPLSPLPVFPLSFFFSARQRNRREVFSPFSPVILFPFPPLFPSPPPLQLREAMFKRWLRSYIFFSPPFVSFLFSDFFFFPLSQRVRVNNESSDGLSLPLSFFCLASFSIFLSCC